MKYSYSSDWIQKQESQRHWIYYWHQINILEPLLAKGDRILEIGVGSGFTANYLRSKSYELVTIDIDEDKKPDILANIVEYSFEENYDHILAFEVFEHIPYEEFVQVLNKLQKHCNKNILISVPRNEKLWFSLQAELPGSRQYGFKIIRKRNRIITKNHHWEIDYKKYTKEFLENEFRNAGFDVTGRRKVFSLYYYSLGKRN